MSKPRYAFHWAEEYFQRGYAVIPLKGKIPPTGFRWKEYQSRRATLEEIRSWFREGSREHYNVGIVTGDISGLTVVDCDTADDVRWWTDHFPTTPMTAVTGGGGGHMYYRANTIHKVRNRTRVLGRKIDIRGDGGYVVAPPSIHPQTGRAYQWQPWDYFAAVEIPLFDPEWLSSAASTSVADLSAPLMRSSSSIRDGPAYISHIQAVSGQGGHNATYRAAASLRDAGMAAEDVLGTLIVWNATNAQPPWSERELIHKVEDVFKTVRK